MSLKLFYDLLSQPSRALYILFKVNKIPFEARPVNLREGEHFSEDFKQNFNRFQKVPFIHDKDFILSESVAIVRYISREYGLSEELYPKDSKQQALVDEYLEWQHNNTRLYCAMYTYEKVFMPMLTGQEPDQKIITRYAKGIKKTMDSIENLWLRENKFICGNKVTVADLFAACEIEQPRITGLNPVAGRPKLEEWLNTIRKEFDPFYSEAHQILNKLSSKNEKAKL
ncbi:glutathione S-transferase theta-1 [Coccinella septempunctata]|uniref:glutathione S-transferase theta-1 n=1 Tax=Coccinella septempunctata TaxID=41139 RepID=UPI001D073C4A|nr:glutathione S-transferase theta-1 [Coccinella septempunctata]